MREAAKHEGERSQARERATHEGGLSMTERANRGREAKHERGS